MENFAAALYSGSKAASTSSLTLADQQAAAEAEAAVAAAIERKARAPRINRACDTCRRRKQRCTGIPPNADPKNPRCEGCVQANRACTFEPPKRTAPKTYAESLEQRLAALEGVLRGLSVQAGVDLGELLDNEDEEEKTVALEMVTERLKGKSSAGSPRYGRDDMAAKPEGLEEQYKQEEMSIEKTRFVGSSSGPMFARRVIGGLMTPAFQLPFEAQPVLVDQLLREEHDLQAKTVPLPPPDLAAALIAAYFTHSNDILPVLHRPSFERAIQAGMLETDTSFRCLLLMVFALGARFLDDPRLEETKPTDARVDTRFSNGSSYFQAATFSLSSCLLPSTLFDIQTSVLGILWLCGATTPILVWNHVGWSIRRAVDVGAHAENRVRWATSPLEDQLRKRAFHLLLTVDRTISAVVGRPLAMQDWETDLSYPVDITDEALDEWNLRGADNPPPPPTRATPVAGLLALVRLQRILGHTLKMLYGVYKNSKSDVDYKLVCEFDSQLNEWRSTIPEHLLWDAAMPAQWLVASAMLHSAFYFCQQLIHRDFLLVDTSKIAVPLPSLAICTNAARSASHLFTVLKDRGKLEDTFWFAPMQLGSAGLVLIINAILKKAPSVESVQQLPSFKSAQTCIDVLEVLSNKTFVAVKVSAHLQRFTAGLIARVSAAALAGLPPPCIEPSTSKACGASGPSPSFVASTPVVSNYNSTTSAFEGVLPDPPALDSLVDLDNWNGFVAEPYSWIPTNGGNDWMEAFGGPAAFELDIWTNRQEQ